jgi:cytochrome P450
MSHPAEYDQFLRGEIVTDTFIDEVLRWSSTNAYVQRIAMAPVTIRGSAIRPGDVVTLWSVSANRDESRFPAANTFRIRRSPNKHLSFGAGIHRCIGAGLGRTELQVVFGHLAHRRVRLVPQGPPTRLRSNFILGTTSMPVEVHDAAPAAG